MKLAEEVEDLERRLDQLEASASVIGDWHRFEARVARAMIHAQVELTALQRELIELVRTEPPDPRWQVQQARARTLRDLVEELTMLRVCAQSRLFEHEAEANQPGFETTGRRV